MHRRLTLGLVILAILMAAPAMAESDIGQIKRGVPSANSIATSRTTRLASGMAVGSRHCRSSSMELRWSLAGPLPLTPITLQPHCLSCIRLAHPIQSSG
jgi:hypothetical protein